MERRTYEEVAKFLLKGNRLRDRSSHAGRYLLLPRHPPLQIGDLDDQNRIPSFAGMTTEREDENVRIMVLPSVEASHGKSYFAALST